MVPIIQETPAFGPFPACAAETLKTQDRLNRVARTPGVPVASMSPMIRDGALLSIGAGACMYDVYLNGRNGLLVVPQDHSIPSDLSGNWRKKKRTVRSVSETIRQDVERRGYHRRSLVGHRSNAASKRTN